MSAQPKQTPPDLVTGLQYLAKHPRRYLFPLVVTDPKRPKGKPAIKNNLADASNDPGQLKSWYAYHVQRGRVIWGLSLKKSGLVAIDVDCGPGKVGEQSLTELARQHGGYEKAFPLTEIVHSPSYTPERRSRHLIYRGAHTFSASKIGLNIDTPNYILIAGTTFADGRRYKLDRDMPPAPLPQWIADAIKPRSTERRNHTGDALPFETFKRMLDATPHTGGPEGLDNRHDYQGWLTFAMECHEAAGGDESEYLDAFIDWSLDDPEAKETWTAESIERHWQSFTCDPPDGRASRTRASWLKLLDALGHSEFIGEANPASSDFEEPEEPGVDWSNVHEHPSATAYKEKLRAEREAEREEQAKEQAKADAFPEPLPLDQLLNGEWPKIEYVLDGLIMRGAVNLFTADGGTGKTTTATQAGVAINTGQQLFGRNTCEPLPVLLVLGEDGERVTQERIRAQLHALSWSSETKLPPLRTWCLPGFDMALAKISDEGVIAYLPFYEKLDREIERTGRGAFVVLDSLVDIVQMNMSLPAPTNAFFKRLLTGLCKKHDCTILVLAHPSKASMTDGSWVHGTLAMKNAVRNVIAMAKVAGQQWRRLWSLKHNYGGDSELHLFFEEGIFTVTKPSDSTNPAVRREHAIREMIIELVRDGDPPVVMVNQGAGITPRDIAERLNRAGGLPGAEIAWREVQAIMRRLRQDGVLRYVEATKHGKAHFELVEEEGADAAADMSDASDFED